ncbi:MAG: M48 family metallopeptidase [Anaerolineae bacterium]|nr:M48 family metallopeptidase [Anaerolineae bacterium]
MTIHAIDYGNSRIEFKLIYSARKTLGIAVHQDEGIVVTAPEASDLDTIKALVHKRGHWILKQRQELDRYPDTPSAREYVSGETYTYLGHRYRLKVLASPKDIVKPTRGWLRVYAQDNDPARIKRLVETWYRRQAKRLFAARLENCYLRARHLGIPCPELSVRRMKNRWGSCPGPGQIQLNVSLVQAPPECIDYVILHELCHLVEANHGPRFEALMDRLLPDWRARRETLNTFEF